MNLGTAGAILSYALELETKSNEFYESVLNDNLDSNKKEAFLAIRRQHQKIIKTLNRMRKENVTEMILEPIHGFESDDYILEISDSLNAASVIATSKQIEDTISKFLSKSAMKVTFLPELSQMLVDLVDRINKNLETISLIDSS